MSDDWEVFENCDELFCVRKGLWWLWLRWNWLLIFPCCIDLHFLLVFDDGLYWKYVYIWGWFLLFLFAFILNLFIIFSPIFFLKNRTYYIFFLLYCINIPNGHQYNNLILILIGGAGVHPKINNTNKINTIPIPTHLATIHVCVSWVYIEVRLNQ